MNRTFYEATKDDGKVKSPSSRRRESRVMRRTDRTPQSQLDEAQRRNRAFYEAIKIDRHEQLSRMFHENLISKRSHVRSSGPDMERA